MKRTRIKVEKERVDLKGRIAVLGLGSWGTALSIVLAHNGYQVSIWGRDQKQCNEVNETRRNRRYLPNVDLPNNIYATSNLSEALENTAAILYVVPSHAMRETVKSTLPYIHENHLFIHATKGLELGSLKRMSEVIREIIPPELKNRVATISGPSHAEEVAIQSPTTVVASSEDVMIAEKVQDIFINSHFRVYTNPDIVGVELGGSLKNIIALGAGMSDGLGFGDNAKAALLTRGIAEIARLGVKMGANPLTFTGLTGVGDLIGTGTSRLSRNWRAGKLIGEGKRANEVQEEIGMVVEGIKTTKAAYDLSQQHNVIMPITSELHQVLFNEKDPKLAVQDLMGRDRTHEVEDLVRFK